MESKYKLQRIFVPFQTILWILRHPSTYKSTKAIKCYLCGLTFCLICNFINLYFECIFEIEDKMQVKVDFKCNISVLIECLFTASAFKRTKLTYILEKKTLEKYFNTFCDFVRKIFIVNKIFVQHLHCHFVHKSLINKEK